MRWSKWSRRWVIAGVLTSASAVWAGETLGGHTADPQTAPSAAHTDASAKQKKEVKSDDKPQGNESGLGSLNTLLPIGKSAFKLSIPSLDEKLRMTSLLKVDKVTRVDEQNLSLEGVRFSSFTYDDAQPLAEPDETIVRLTTATYHLSDKILVSHELARITKKGLVMIGRKGLVFYAEESRVTLIGPTQSIIDDPAEEEAPSKPLPGTENPSRSASSERVPVLAPVEADDQASPPASPN